MTRREILDALPDSATLPVSFVRQLLLEVEAVSDGADLTAAQAGKILGRSPSSIRTWCASGALEGHRFRNREWRIPRWALEKFQENEREAHAIKGTGKTASRATGRKSTLGEWRKVREKAT